METSWRNYKKPWKQYRWVEETSFSLITLHILMNKHNNITKSSNVSQNSSKKHSFTTYNNSNTEYCHNINTNNHVASNSNGKSNTRSVSRRKGISLCSKEIKGGENNRHNRSVITTMASYSNDKYQRLSTNNNPIK